MSFNENPNFFPNKKLKMAWDHQHMVGPLLLNKEIRILNILKMILRETDINYSN